MISKLCFVLPVARAMGMPASRCVSATTVEGTYEALDQRDGTAHGRDLAEERFLHLYAFGEVVFHAELVQQTIVREEVLRRFVLDWLVSVGIVASTHPCPLCRL